MRTIKVPHYKQMTPSDCQAACAAMVLDYFAARSDGGTPERLAELMDEFSFGFRPESGRSPPAITGLVAITVAKKGFSVAFYSKCPDGGGPEGLAFLRNLPYEFTEGDLESYAALARSKVTDATEHGVTVHDSGMSEQDVELAISKGQPVVAIVDAKVLKNHPQNDNHAVVITGINDSQVAIHDPADSTPDKHYDRSRFFEAHRQTGTDHDAYVVSPRNSTMSTDFYECWELDGHVLVNVRGKEYVIDTGSPHTYTSENDLRIGELAIEGSTPPAGLLESLPRNVSPGVVGLIGLDVIGRYDVSISLGNRVIGFHTNVLSLPGSRALPVGRAAESVPILQNLLVNGRSFEALLDLGARFSYLAIPDADQGRGFGSAWDFWPANPAIDRFPVRLHNVTLRISDRDCPMTAGDRADVADAQRQLSRHEIWPCADDIANCVGRMWIA
jgi:hypothetical protein